MGEMRVMDETNRPKVGIGVLIIKEGKVLLGKRRGALGHGSYGGPGGHLECMESFAECAQRETHEETGIEIENVRFLCLTNLITFAPKHYVDVGLIADWKSGEPERREPEKCDGWGWYDIDDLPTPLFGAVGNYFQAYNFGVHYYDT